ncbi:MAG: MliC family protein [Burkholderiaceae bacterium]|nr:MliC family protein [Burkholderiaceae bacterium]
MPTSLSVRQPRHATTWLCLGLVTLLAACAAAPESPVAASPPPLRDVTPAPAAPVAAPAPAPATAAAPAPAPLAQTPADLTVPPAPPILRGEEVQSSGQPKAAPSGPPFDAGGSLSMEPGLYRCELNRRVVVRRIAPDGQSMVINWLGKDASLQAVRARSGALRFENVQAGMVWIVIVGKSMLLDSRAGRTLANECKL